MSQRHYTGPSPKRSPLWIANALAWVLALATIGFNIAFVLADARDQPALAIASVYAFFLASLVHAAAHRGFGAGLLVGVVVPVIGWVAEAIGTQTGWPFGSYTYQDTLGPTLGDVPVVVPLAWAMMAYPTFIAARRLSHQRWWVVIIGAWSLMAWDLFLDPLMVDLGAWTWKTPETTLPGVSDIPLQNFAGWFAVSLVVMGVLSWMPRLKASIAQPATLYLWVFSSSVVANVAYFERPQVAVVGGVCMGFVAAPFAWKLWTERR